MQKTVLDSYGQPINIWVEDEPKKQKKNAKRKGKKNGCKIKEKTGKTKSGKDDSGNKI